MQQYFGRRRYAALCYFGRLCRVVQNPSLHPLIPARKSSFSTRSSGARPGPTLLETLVAEPHGVVFDLIRHKISLIVILSTRSFALACYAATRVRIDGSHRFPRIGYELAYKGPDALPVLHVFPSIHSTSTLCSSSAAGTVGQYHPP